MNARVWCYSGFKYPQRPTAFVWGDQKLTVQKVWSSWRTEDAENFLVHTQCGGEYLLQYYSSEDRWKITNKDADEKLS